jgi:hypothetical protein
MDSAASRAVTDIDDEIEDLEAADILRFSLADKGNPNANIYTSNSAGWVEKSTSSSTSFRFHCHYVPGLGKSLISVGALDRLGYTVVFGGGKCRVWKDQTLQAVGELVPNNLYRMAFGPTCSLNVTSTEPENATTKWHKRLVHRAVRSLA